MIEDGITSSMDMGLTALGVGDEQNPGMLQCMGSRESDHEQLNNNNKPYR